MCCFHVRTTRGSANFKFTTFLCAEPFPQQRFFNPFGNKDVKDGLAGFAGGLASQYFVTSVSIILKRQ